MRKIILFIAIMAVVGLLLFGCAAQKAPTAPKAPAKKAPMKVEPVEPEAEPEGEPEVEEEEAEEEEEELEEEAEPEEEEEPGEVEVPLSQEDLDKLKQDIEGMEIEDLGGLSED